MTDKIQFVDQTIRDAQQSLWGNMMRTDMIILYAEDVIADRSWKTDYVDFNPDFALGTVAIIRKII